MTTGHYEDDKLGGAKFVPHREDPDTAMEKTREQNAVQDHIDAEKSVQVVNIREKDGKTVVAQYIRPLTFPGYEGFRLALTLSKGHYSVSELTSGACLSECPDMFVALQTAKVQLTAKSPRKMRRAVEDICARYGKLDATIRTIPASSIPQGESQK
jgi:hypothetical protein